MVFVSNCRHLFDIIQLSRWALFVWKYERCERPWIFVTFWPIHLDEEFSKRYDLSLPPRFPYVKLFSTDFAMIASVKYVAYYRLRSTRWCSWLRHCATSWNIADSIVIGIFHWRHLSGRIMTQGSIQPLTEMSIRGISWERKGGRCLWLTTLSATYTECLEILRVSTSWHPNGLSRPVQGSLYWTPNFLDPIFPTSQQTLAFSITYTDWLMLFR